MIKLSRAGWNNIIIFGVMGFILLINATHDNVFSNKNSDDKVANILGQQAVILTLTINQTFKVERIGKSWRVSAETLAGQALEQMMRSWQQLEGEKIAPPENLDQQLGLIVNIELAGQSSPSTLSLFVDDQQLLIYHQQQAQWYLLPLPIYQQLIPEQVFL